MNPSPEVLVVCKTIGVRITTGFLCIRGVFFGGSTDVVPVLGVVFFLVPCNFDMALIVVVEVEGVVL